MAEDILAELRAKEEEMEALINAARREASSVKEAALKSARELRQERSRLLEEELKKAFEAGVREASEEARKIEEEGRKDAESLKARGERRLDRVVSEVVKFIVEPQGQGR